MGFLDKNDNQSVLNDTYIWISTIGQKIIEELKTGKYSQQKLTQKIIKEKPSKRMKLFRK